MNESRLPNFSTNQLTSAQLKQRQIDLFKRIQAEREQKRKEDRRIKIPKYKKLALTSLNNNNNSSIIVKSNNEISELMRNNLVFTAIGAGCINIIRET